MMQGVYPIDTETNDETEPQTQVGGDERPDSRKKRLGSTHRNSRMMFRG